MEPIFYSAHFPRNSIGTFECTVCVETFKEATDILKHYKTFHDCVKFINCLQCNKKYTNLQQLKGHMKLKYSLFNRGHARYKIEKKVSQKLARDCNKSKFNICNTCHTKYTTSNLLQQHQREHQIHISLKCTKCKKNFENQKQSEEHKRQCSGEHFKYACKMCNRTFPCVSQRENHLRTDHPFSKE